MAKEKREIDPIIVDSAYLSTTPGDTIYKIRPRGIFGIPDRKGHTIIVGPDYLDEINDQGEEFTRAREDVDPYLLDFLRNKFNYINYIKGK